MVRSAYDVWGGRIEEGIGLITRRASLTALLLLSLSSAYAREPVMKSNMKSSGRLQPPGWTYNPSSWNERLWLIGVALLGFLISGYLVLYQWGLFATAWEPFLGSGSDVVQHSALSRMLPIPDAALGASAYALDAVAGAIGGSARWRTMPWIVLLFGLAVGPLGLVSVLLVMAQPLLLNAWCTLCLASAVISLVMIGPAMDEVLTSLQFLKSVNDRKMPMWRAFWKGETGMALGGF